jgi:hypothetical protein
LDYRAKDGTGEAPWPICLETTSVKIITYQYHGYCYGIDAKYMTRARLSTAIPPMLTPSKAAWEPILVPVMIIVTGWIATAANI